MIAKMFKIVSEPLENNTYVVELGNEAILIDASCPINQIKEKTHLPIVAIFLTHGHFDHIYKLDEIMKEYPDAKCYVSKFDFDKICDDYLNCAIRRSVRLNLKIDLSRVKQIDEGDIIEINNKKIEVFSTPGHTSGSVVYKIDDVLFTGDTIFNGYYGRTDLPTGSFESMRESIRKIKEKFLGYRFYCGHGDDGII